MMLTPMINLSTKLTPIYVHVNKSSLALVLHQKLLQYNKKKKKLSKSILVTVVIIKVNI